MNNKRFNIAALFVFFSSLFSVNAALPPIDSQGNTLPSLAPMLEQVTPAIVNINTKSRVRVRDNPLLMDPFFQRFFGIPDVPRERETQSLGSGVIVDAVNGYVVTNNHVIDKADEITVTLRDSRSFVATVVGVDPEADVAVIKIPAQDLVAVPKADSDQLRVGDFVVAIGNPFGLGQTVTSGIVSALGRSGLGIEGYEDFIQTDASINPGNSGGALVNLRGELVGVNTAILAPTGGNVGIGFAIPINMVNYIKDELVQYGAVRRGKLGIVLQDLTPQLANAFNLPTKQGVVVARVIEGSVAEEAGLQVGDVITTIDGRPIRKSAELRNVMGLLKVGERAKVSVLRDGKRELVQIEVKPPQIASLDGALLHANLAGARLSEITEFSNLYGRVSGVLIAEVVEQSVAWRTGLRSGDVVVAANRRPVGNLEQLKAVASVSNGLLLQVQRGRTAQFLLLE